MNTFGVSCVSRTPPSDTLRVPKKMVVDKPELCGQTEMGSFTGSVPWTRLVPPLSLSPQLWEIRVRNPRHCEASVFYKVFGMASFAFIIITRINLQNSPME